MEIQDVNMKHWLTETPNYTTFRINKLKTFDPSILHACLVNQSMDLKAHQIPKYSILRPDCLILEQWADDIAVEKTGKEVIVDALCAAAVLRGAHVFAPGVLGLPVNCRIGERVDIYGDLEGHCKRGLKIPYEVV